MFTLAVKARAPSEREESEESGMKRGERKAAGVNQCLCSTIRLRMVGRSRYVFDVVSLRISTALFGLCFLEEFSAVVIY